MDEKDERYEQARKRVEDIKGFYVHVAIYVVVNVGLFAINMLTNPGTVWFYWPALGWGIGVAVHAVALFADVGPLGPDWERRKIAEYMGGEDPPKDQAA